MSVVSIELQGLERNIFVLPRVLLKEAGLKESSLLTVSVDHRSCYRTSVQHGSI